MELKHLALVLLVFCASCDKEQWDDCITSTGPIRSDERSVGAYREVDLEDRVDLVIEDRPQGTVRVEGGNNLLGEVVTDVSDGVLHVRNDNRCNWVRSFKPRITVYVAAADVAQLTLRGTGNVNSTTTLHRDVLHIDQHGGQGTVLLSIAVDSCFIGTHSGAGDVHCTGTANFIHLYSQAIGSIGVENVEAHVVDAYNSGIGDMHCRGSERVTATTTYVGDIYYHGSTVLLQATVLGEGEVINVP